MSSTPPTDPTSPRPFTRALGLAGATTLLYGALLVAVFGITSLTLDRDIIPEADAGPLVGIAYVTPALAIVFVSVLGGLAPHATRGIPIARALLTGVLVFLASPLVSAGMYAIVTAQLGNGPSFALARLISPFTAAAALLALLAVIAIPGIRWARSAPR